MTIETTIDYRCRLVLIVPAIENAQEMLLDALNGGDVASIIITRGEFDEAKFQDHSSLLCKLARDHGVAAVIESDSRVMGRSGADGLYVSSGIDNLKDAIARFSPKRIVGYGGIKTRHVAMEAGEEKPDFLFFGRLNGDIKPDAHPKNLALGEWCAEVMQVSAIVMGGSAIESVVEVAETGVEFVALGLAVFAHTDGPGKAVSMANALLEKHAPRFEDAE